ncbi:MAG: hypothetical protein ACRD2I_01290 [Vicinamibacterales bacterium]
MLIYVAAGVLAGIAYTLSPLTVCCAIAIGLMIRFGGRGLEPAERRRLQIVLAVAIGVRVLTVAGLFLATDHSRVPFGSFFGDEEYFLRRSMWLRNVGLGIPIHRADLIYAFDDYSETSQLYILGFLQTLVGFAPYGAHLVGIALYLATVVLLFGLVRPAFGAMPALLGLLLMLTLPSLFAWSISALKEPLFFALTAVALVSVVAAVREPRWGRKIALIAIAVIGSVALQTLRRAGFALEAASIVGGIVLAWIIVRPKLAIAAAIAVIFAASVALARPNVEVAVSDALVQAATYHRGHIWTPGRTYHLLDDRLYTELVDIRTMRFDEAARFVTRALFTYVTVPLPMQIYSTAALAFLPEQMVWYLLVGIAPIGLVFAMRRDVLIASMLLTHAAVAALLIAFTSGNIGTLVRHRGFALPYVIWISAVGACELLARGAASGRVQKV